MNTSNTDQCTCTSDGYSPECPKTFVQGGKYVHVLSPGDQLKPRRYGPPDLMKSIENGAPTMEEMEDALDEVDKLSNQLKGLSPQPLVRRYSPETNMGRQRMNDDEALIARHRAKIEKFQPLTVDGVSLTKMSVGGFEIDLAQTAEAVREYVALPKSHLPVIFDDAEMNFHHHFFQGMEHMLGRTQLSEIVQLSKYYEDDKPVLFDFIESILKFGHENHDDVITTFTKKVLVATFVLPDEKSSSKSDRRLIVRANPFGFRYIEQKMQCSEAELKMWLSSCHDHFKNLWFDTFKSSGIPLFAMDGVQSRYRARLSEIERESRPEPRTFSREITPPSDKGAEIDEEAYRRYKEERRRQKYERSARKSGDSKSKRSFF